VVEVGSDSVIGYEEVGPAFVVVVRGADGEVFAIRLEDAGGFGDVGERSIAIVVIEQRRTAFVESLSAVGRAAGELAMPLLRPDSSSRFRPDIAQYIIPDRRLGSCTRTVRFCPDIQDDRSSEKYLLEIHCVCSSRPNT